MCWLVLRYKVGAQHARHRCQNSMSVPNPYRPFNYSSCSQHYAMNTVHSVRRKKRSELREALLFIPNAYCLLVYNKSIRIFHESIQYRIYIRYSPAYLVLYSMQCIRHYGLQITWYYQVPWANPVPQ